MMKPLSGEYILNKNKETLASDLSEFELNILI